MKTKTPYIRVLCICLASLGLWTLVPTSALGEEPQARTLFNVKTNLLYDLATAVNFSVEVPLAPRFSLQYNQICPWWNIKDQYCLQAFVFGGEGRWYIGNGSRVGQGHYLAVYGLKGKTDFQWQREGCYQVQYKSAGLTYGYAFPLGKSLRLELALGAGYSHLSYQHYFPAEDYEVLFRDRDDQGVIHRWGPTRLQVNLSIPIRAKAQAQKGGAR